MPPMKTAQSLSPVLQKLQDSWKTMFQKTLPKAATSKSPSQPKWPVHVDHCFARIILDKVVGEGKVPWMTVIKSPAYKNMSEGQLKAAISLGDNILSGGADLVELDEESLMVRGKRGKKNAAGRKTGKMSKQEMVEADRKRRQPEDTAEKDVTQGTKEETETEPKQEVLNESLEDEALSDHNIASPIHASKEEEPSSRNETSPISDRKRRLSNEETPASPPSKVRKTSSHKPDPALQSKINSSSKTSFQKTVLSLLLEIPTGCYTTYNLMSKRLYSSPRAVGNALRNNPFAPEVPCHRVLATGGGIGGFGGSWGKKGEEGKNDKEKYRLLKSEGVRFDGKGRVVGSPWNGFS
ncbi:hypothetical protein E2P81_ATG07301 [Venturia nashicola]|uniref:Methylated-DNA--protein-cysteine methyltransferase n=1 Tax=Venturia nashicola TaxID=86259 RepID=A0A4Z1NVM0_9PEZI|nr:hypothetical protein E6O75_ATG07461 [Venturia nashicola]TLD31811.1 hypothetical protein E2P81_ATG07301 [Venturia nashicola]